MLKVPPLSDDKKERRVGRAMRIIFLIAVFLVCFATFGERAAGMTLEEAKDLVQKYADAEGAPQAERVKALDSLKRLSEVIPPEQAYKIALTALQSRKSIAHKGESVAENRLRPANKGGDMPPVQAHDTPSENTEISARAHRREDKQTSQTTNEGLEVKPSSEKIPQNQVAGKKPEKCRIIENSLKVGTVKTDPIIEPVLIRPTFGIDECAQR